jgi:hypothetical protein
MALSLYRLPGSKVGDLTWRERADLWALLLRAEPSSADPRAYLRKATAWLERRVVDKLADELHGGVEHLREIQFRHAGLSDDFRAPAAAVAALAWLRAAEMMLEAGMEPEALAILAKLFPARGEVDQAPRPST